MPLRGRRPVAARPRMTRAVPPARVGVCDAAFCAERPRLCLRRALWHSGRRAPSALLQRRGPAAPSLLRELQLRRWHPGVRARRQLLPRRDGARRRLLLWRGLLGGAGLSERLPVRGRGGGLQPLALPHRCRVLAGSLTPLPRGRGLPARRAMREGARGRRWAHARAAVTWPRETCWATAPASRTRTARRARAARARAR